MGSLPALWIASNAPKVAKAIAATVKMNSAAVSHRNMRRAWRLMRRLQRVCRVAFRPRSFYVGQVLGKTAPARQLGGVRRSPCAEESRQRGFGCEAVAGGACARAAPRAPGLRIDPRENRAGVGDDRPVGQLERRQFCWAGRGSQVFARFVAQERERITVTGDHFFVMGRREVSFGKPG